MDNQEHQGEVETEYNLAHILVATPEGMSAAAREDAKKIAEKVLADLKSGGDFAQLAATYSDSQDALDGGKLGWRKAGQVPTLFAESVADMGKGDVSDIIRSSSGYHIITLLDVRSTEQVVVTQTSARHILIRTDELIDDEDARRRLQQLLLRLKRRWTISPTSPEAILMTVSVLLMVVAWAGSVLAILVPEFEAAMNSLAPGEVSQPFKTQFRSSYCTSA